MGRTFKIIQCDRLSNGNVITVKVDVDEIASNPFLKRLSEDCKWVGKLRDKYIRWVLERNNIGLSGFLSKSKVIHLIGTGVKFKVGDSKVIAYPFNNPTHIRTKGNKVKTDNFDNLPPISKEKE